MIGGNQLRSCGKLSAAGPPSTFPQPPQLRRRANVLTMSLDECVDECVSYLSGTYKACFRVKSPAGPDYPRGRP